MVRIYRRTIAHGFAVVPPVIGKWQWTEGTNVVRIRLRAQSFLFPAIGNGSRRTQVRGADPADDRTRLRGCSPDVGNGSGGTHLRGAVPRHRHTA
jgi:hypothetical protein